MVAKKEIEEGMVLEKRTVLFFIRKNKAVPNL